MSELPPPAPDPLLAWRDQFPIVDRTTYLISNSLGAMPEGASEALAEYGEMWDTVGIKAWEQGWWDIVTEIGDLAAPLLGVPAGTVVMQPSVTIASAIVRSCFDWAGHRNRIVYTELEFPSVMYLYSGAQAEGAEIVVVPTRGDGITVDLNQLNRDFLCGRPIGEVILSLSARVEEGDPISRCHPR